ncbi:universal stress protein [Mucilaginibacter sp. S1162]|uniref:Universal stress protein n=1 Tax=Mucilaginibacter humi TaxID=2732510 RepID=A0ABX1W0B9_9SPHI|nr:universal stress protein [Mucilaginibacter humi]
MVIAAQFGAGVWLVNVYPITPYLPPVGTTALPVLTADEKRRESMSKLNREVRRLDRVKFRELSGQRPVVRPIAMEGQLAERAAALAHRKKSLLIVMGLSERSYGDVLFKGEVKAVLQQVRCPVLASPVDLVDAGVHHIFFATDLAAEDEPVIGELVNFAARLKARLTVGHVSRPVLIPDFAEESRSLAFGERMRSLHPAIRYTNPRASNVTDALEKINTEKRIDMVALRYREHPFWYHLFHENPLKELLKQGKSPLLIFPENAMRHE